jgi:hypothetical protein
MSDFPKPTTTPPRREEPTQPQDLEDYLYEYFEPLILLGKSSLPFIIFLAVTVGAVAFSWLLTFLVNRLLDYSLKIGIGVIFTIYLAGYRAIYLIVRKHIRGGKR